MPFFQAWRSKASFSGACTETDCDGDHVFTSFDGAPYKLIGGTGKYKEISARLCPFYAA